MTCVRTWILTLTYFQLFLAVSIALNAVPVGLFFLFAINVILFTLVTGFLAMFSFIALCTGSALLILLPAVAFATLTAAFVSLWLYVGYTIFCWARGVRSVSGKQKAIQPETRLGPTLEIRSKPAAASHE